MPTTKAASKAPIRSYTYVSLFPQMFNALSNEGVVGRAVKEGLIKFNFFNPRDFTYDKHKTVDDRPYGGGPGMLMKVQPLEDALAAAKQANPKAKVIYLSPQGRQLNQQGVEYLAELEEIIFIAGRYEGIDERLVASQVDEEWSIGDYVLSGGELAAMVVTDALARLVPGVLGHSASAEEDSFADGLLDCPHYTRPEVINARQVPEVLLSGNHAAIKTWRLKQALGRTWQRRPDLLAKRQLSNTEKDLLNQFIQEQQPT